MAKAKLKSEGIRFTKTGEAIPLPDWEDFKKDYPNVKQAK